MTAPAKRSPSSAEPHANPFRAFLSSHPGAISAIAWGVGIGAAVGVALGLLLPGRGASHRAAVALLFALGVALVGGLIATAINSAPPRSSHTRKDSS